jgi:hypothetical protein
MKMERQSWNEYIFQLQTDLYRLKRQTYKILKHLSKETTDIIRINPILKEQWLQYFEDLWTHRPTHYHIDQNMTNETLTKDVTMEELGPVLKTIRQHKAPEEDKLNLELSKYAGQSFNRRFLFLRN